MPVNLVFLSKTMPRGRTPSLLSKAIITSILMAGAYLGELKANAQDYREAGRALVACYNAAAVYYGEQTCDSPSTIIGAVLGRCEQEERALRRALETGENPDPEFSANVIRSIRSDLGLKLQSLILDSRIRANRGCPLNSK